MLPCTWTCSGWSTYARLHCMHGTIYGMEHKRWRTSVLACAPRRIERGQNSKYSLRRYSFFFKSQNISSLIKFMYNKILAFMITNKYIRFFIKYTFIIYLFGTIDFCNLFFIILVKYKNSLTFQKSWNELIIWNAGSRGEDWRDVLSFLCMLRGYLARLRVKGFPKANGLSR